MPDSLQQSLGDEYQVSIHHCQGHGLVRESETLLKDGSQPPDEAPGILQVAQRVDPYVGQHGRDQCARARLPDAGVELISQQSYLIWGDEAVVRIVQ